MIVLRLAPSLLLLVFVSTESPNINHSRWTKDDIIRPGAVEEDTELLPEDFQAAEETPDVDLSVFGIRSHGDPIANSGKFEGDIAGLTPDTLEEYVRNSNDRRRNAVRNQWRRWPDGEIPYVLSSRYGSYSKRTIARAMKEYHDKTCVKFVPRDTAKHRDYIYIHPDDGCYSLVGRTGGRQALSLDAGCIQTGTVIHELMHTIGFFHEQSRNDRDRYIEIVWNNVLSEAKDQFEKYSLRQITHLNEEYDYNSIMHYGPYAFTRNGRKTVKTLKSGGGNMGQREGFSTIDLAKINKMYKCDSKSETTNPRERTTTKKPTTTRRASRGECKDYNWRCRFWTLKVIDYCTKYEKVRLELCPKSCETCTDSDVPTTPRPTPSTTTAAPASNCKNNNPACSRWAKKGYCTKSGYSRFMRKTCKRSCDICVSSDGRKETQNKEVTEEGGEEGGCRDSPKVQCKLSKLLGGCQARRHRRLMEKNCRKTCGLC